MLERLLGEELRRAPRLASPWLSAARASTPSASIPQWAKFALTTVAAAAPQATSAREVHGIENVPDRDASCSSPTTRGRSRSTARSSAPPCSWTPSRRASSAPWSRSGRSACRSCRSSSRASARSSACPRTPSACSRKARRCSSFPRGRGASRRPSTSATSSPSSASASCASPSRPDTPIVPVARRRRRGAVRLARQRRDPRQAAPHARLPHHPAAPPARRPAAAAHQVPPLVRRAHALRGAIRTTTTRSSTRRSGSSKQTIQSMLNRGLKERKHIFW